jgi:hypothetical protein
MSVAFDLAGVKGGLSCLASLLEDRNEQELADVCQNYADRVERAEEMLLELARIRVPR